MSINKKFELYKIKREIKRSGEEFAFYRKKRSKYGEEIEELELIGKLKGIFHESNNTYFNVVTSESANVVTKAQPNILTTYEDVSALKIIKDNILIYKNDTYIVNKVEDIQKWEIAADISFTKVEKEIVYNG